MLGLVFSFYLLFIPLLLNRHKFSSQTLATDPISVQSMQLYRLVTERNMN